MSKTIELTDEQYRVIEHAAARRGQSPDALLAQWVEALRDPYADPRYFTDDELLRHLGMSEEMIRQAEDLAARDEDAGDADL
jgi:hypothetical protein